MQGVLNRVRNDIPPDILCSIFLYLDLSTIRACLLACKYFLITIESHLWKDLILRDYCHFLYLQPLSEEELEYPSKESELQTIPEDPFEANQIIKDPFKEPIQWQNQNAILSNINAIQNFKQFYQKCFISPNLSGFWIGDYGDHGFELVRIYHKGYQLYGKKLTGDSNVPAGKLTWKMTLGNEMKSGKGLIHLAEEGYVNSKWSTAYVDTSAKDVFKITWFVQDQFNNWFSLTFSNVKAGMKDYEPLLMAERIGLVHFEEELEEEF